jgi:hypothetical protein
MLRSVRKFVAIATPRSHSDDAERVLGKPEGIGFTAELVL